MPYLDTDTLLAQLTALAEKQHDFLGNIDANLGRYPYARTASLLSLDDWTVKISGVDDVFELYFERRAAHIGAQAASFPFSRSSMRSTGTCSCTLRKSQTRKI